MKNHYMVAVILHLLFAFSQIGCAQTVSQKKSGQRAIAIVLKITGKDAKPERIELYNKTVFEGKVKVLKSNTASQFSEPVHVKFFKESGELIYEEYMQNPLKRHIESFEPDGVIKNNEVANDSNGYINIRFGIEENVSSMKVEGYVIVNGKEALLSTINISIP